MSQQTTELSPLHAGSPARRQHLYLVLASFFLTNAILAEIIGTKIFSLEALLGIAGAQLPLFGMKLDFNLTCGALLWPFVFISTDIINEYFGPQGVRKLSWIGVVMIVYMFGMVWLVTRTPPATFWLDINSRDELGRPFDVNFAYGTIFRQGMGIMIGSVSAFLIGQVADAYIFHSLRRRTGERLIWLRATGSTVVSQIVDSFVVIYRAFYLLAPAGQRWSFDQVIAVSIVNYMYKFTAALVLTPVLYPVHSIIDKYLGTKTKVPAPVPGLTEF